MPQPLNSLFSHSFEAICELGLLSLSRADGMMRCQFSHTREFWAALSLWQAESMRLVEQQAAA